MQTTLVPGLVEQTSIMGVPGSGFGQPVPWLGRTPVGALPPARSSMGVERGGAVRFGLNVLVLCELVLSALVLSAECVEDQSVSHDTL